MDFVFLYAGHTSGAAVIRSAPPVHVTPSVLINILMLQAAHRAGMREQCFISTGGGDLSGDRRSPVTEPEAFDGDPAEVYFAAGWMKRYAESLPYAPTASWKHQPLPEA